MPNGNFWVRAVYTFNTQVEGGLPFSKGAVIRIVAGRMDPSPQGNWLVGELNGRKGNVPSNYCEFVSAIADPIQTSQTLYRIPKI